MRRWAGVEGLELDSQISIAAAAVCVPSVLFLCLYTACFHILVLIQRDERERGRGVTTKCIHPRTHTHKKTQTHTHPYTYSYIKYCCCRATSQSGFFFLQRITSTYVWCCFVFCGSHYVNLLFVFCLLLPLCNILNCHNNATACHTCMITSLRMFHMQIKYFLKFYLKLLKYHTGN